MVITYPAHRNEVVDGGYVEGVFSLFYIYFLGTKTS